MRKDPNDLELAIQALEERRLKLENGINDFQERLLDFTGKIEVFFEKQRKLKLLGDKIISRIKLHR
jgi:hypothetical protein